MISRIIKKTVDLSKIQKVDQLEGPLYQLENGGHTFEITCLMDGAAASVSGTVSARFLRADEQTVYFTGTLTGNVVSITLPQSCYVSNGRFGLVVFVSGNDVTSAVYAVAGNVYRSTSDHIIDPTEEIPSLEDLIAKIGECEEATADAEAAASTANAAAAAAVGNFATDYANLTFPVKVGTHCTHDGNYYVSNTQIDSSETWTAAHWTQVTAGAEISNLKSAIGDSDYTLIGRQNLISEWIDGKLVGSTGAISDNTSYEMAGPINVHAGTYEIVYTQASGYTRVCGYDSNDDPVTPLLLNSSGVLDKYRRVITVPDGVSTVRMSTSKTGKIYGFIEGIGIDKQLSAITEDFVNLMSSEAGYAFLISQMSVAYLDANGDVKTDDDRATFTDFMKLPFESVLSFDLGYRGTLCTYNSSYVMQSRVVVLKGQSTEIPANTYFRVTVFKDPAEMISDPYSYREKCRISLPTQTRLSEVESGLSALTSKVNGMVSVTPIIGEDYTLTLTI